MLHDLWNNNGDGMVFEGARLLGLVWFALVFLCVYVVGAINGVEPLEDRNKKLQLCEIKSTFSFYYFS
jgi:hypothetical protein